ncbi:NUDIX hydrolase [Nocardioides cheoyonin]|uniref:NUDIX hydrolase n=1 Tax=Nocardioides cheoyonin TaxID=3156615 RepID=UPI0032B559A1
MILPYKPVDRRRIRVKAFAVILDRTAERHAVARMATAENPVFHRPLGGSVKHGEHSSEAVVREVAEELGATFVEPVLLGVLESLFTIEGESGHEIVFVYAGRLAEQEAIPDEGRPFRDLDKDRYVEWRPVTGLLDVPLLPEGLQDLIDVWVKT